MKNKQEPIAIIGIGCRFPGAGNPEAFWRLMRDGVDAISEVPKSRWDVEQFYDPDSTKPDKANTRWGGFLDEIDRFDPNFFGISPKEALTIDPQQRLLLEVAWEAIEDAGIVPEKLAGTRTGVFVGIGTHDYSILLWRHPVNNPYVTTGTGNCIAANRISYLFDLIGPSLAVDTACSSSLVAVHLACESIWRGESNMALVGGVNVLLVPEIVVGFSKGGFMSPDGRCKSFDAKANGYVRGEGAGIVVLKPLSQAEADGDSIYAVIRGTAVNQDGRTDGIAAPNPQAQEAVLRAAYQKAGIAPSEVQYVEAHGTGTKVGDSVEIQALGTVLAQNRPKENYCSIGSVKTNIGHSETAAGIAGLIKVALSLKNREIPPSLHCHTPNPDLAKFPLRVQQHLTPWSEGSHPTIAAVSSFGFGGTNAHIVLAKAPFGRQKVKGKRQKEEKIQPLLHLLTLSAKSDKALRELAQRYREFVTENPTLEVADLCFAANTKRSHFNHRLAVVAESRQQLQEQLDNFVVGEEASGLVTGYSTNQKSPQIAFLFTGQGSQYVNMGRELYDTEPVFRDAIDRCAKILKPYLKTPLLKLLYPKIQNPKAKIDKTAYTQPALFALEYALCQLWMSWGISPAVVMGHSVGEYVAATVAGVFSLEDGLKLIANRARLMQELPENGAMVAVFADEELVSFIIEPYKSEVSIAAINGPENIVISGKRESIEAIIADLQAEEIKTKKLNVSHAFHSPLMQPMLADFAKVAAKISYSPPKIDLISNVTGELIGDEIATAEYWCKQIMQPVQFVASMQTLARNGIKIFVEIGASPVLLGMGRSVLETESSAKSLLYLPSLRSSCSDRQQMLQSLAQLYVNGIKADWSSFDRHYSINSVKLPTYPFQRERYWWTPPETTIDRSISFPSLNGSSNKSFHPLLGQRLYLAGSNEIRFQSEISQNSPTYLKDHCVFNQPIFPASGYLEMVLAAVKSTNIEGARLPRPYLGNNPNERLETIDNTQNLFIENLIIDRPLTFVEAETKIVQIVVNLESDLEYSWQIFSFNTEKNNLNALDRANSKSTIELNFLLHARGKISLAETKALTKDLDLARLQAECYEEISIENYYRHLQEQGLNYGSSFQGIKKLWRGDRQALGKIKLPENLVSDEGIYQLHPVLLDAAFQVLGSILIDHSKTETFLPVGLDNLEFYRHPCQSLWSYVRLEEINSKQLLKANLQLFDETGAIVAVITGLTLRSISRQSLVKTYGDLSLIESDNVDRYLYEIAWRSKNRNERKVTSKSSESWLIFAERQGIGVKIAEVLEEKGDRVFLVFPGQSYSSSDKFNYYIDPTQPEDFFSLLKNISQESDRTLDKIIYLWSLDSIGNRELTSPPTPLLVGEGSREKKEIVDFKFLEQTEIASCGSILHLIQSLVRVRGSDLPRLWLITQGTQQVETNLSPLQIQQASVWGLARVIDLEHPELKCTRIDLDPKRNNIEILLEELCFPDTENQIAYRQENRYVARLIRKSIAENEKQKQFIASNPVRLKTSGYGILDNLTLAPMTLRPPAAGEVEIEVCAAGVNFRDVLNALGMLQEYLEAMGFADAKEIPFGGECAGKIVAVGEGVEDFAVGDKVIAALALGSFASFVTIDAKLVVNKPQNLTFTEAATITTAFLTAYYGLHHLAKIKPGDKVLIHAAAGGVGQAAVQIAQKAGAEVFATASPSKWDFLRSIGIKHIANSRSLDFATEIMTMTEEKGVDIVLNSLNGEFIPKSLDILAKEGRFVEIGKIGIWDEDRVKDTRSDVAYFPFDLLDISLSNPDLIASMLKELMQEFTRDNFKPLPHKVFSIEESSNAFRYMAAAKHIGKVVISLPKIESANLMVRDDSCYLITGGWGALGLQVANWLVEKGAKHLILIGRNQPSEAAKEQINQLESAGTQITILQADISNLESLAPSLPFSPAPPHPLRGVIHAAGILDDGLLVNLSEERFAKVMNPKVAGALNLHNLTLDAPLDFFICFSSIASLIGSPGQGNYAAANAFMDALMQYRRSLDLPGLSINWTAWEGAGMAATLSDRDRSRFAKKGIGNISPELGLQLLEKLHQIGATNIGVMPIDWVKFAQNSPEGQDFPFFEELLPKKEQNTTQRSKFFQELEAIPEANRYNVLLDLVRSQVAKVLGFNSAESIEPQQDFGDLGMDSLMAVELTSRLQASLGCSLSMKLAFDYPSVTAVANYLVEEVLASNNLKTPEIKQKEELVSEKITEEVEINKPTTPELEIPPEFYQFNLAPEYLQLKDYLTEGKKFGSNFFTVHEDVAREVIQIDGRQLINYSNYNYLGICGDPRVDRSAKEAIERYGTSVSASRVVSGEIPLHRELEREIADFLGTEDCIVYIGGHTTNETTIGHLFGKNDLIVYDALSHNSIRQGCKLSGATAIEFPHNDWHALDRILAQKRDRYEKTLIAIEGVYSTDGDIAPLPEIVAIKQRYKTFLMVDEAHSIGTLGATGRGIGEYFGVKPSDVDLWMGTLSKSFASCGGYIATSEALVEYLKYTAPGFLFSVGMSPPNTAAALSAIRLLKAEPKRVTLLQQKAKLFAELAQSKGFDIGTSKDSPVIPIIVGQPDRAVRLSKALFEKGINVQPMVYPSVPYNASRLRFFITCTHTEAQIRSTIERIDFLQKVEN